MEETLREFVIRGCISNKELIQRAGIRNEVATNIRSGKVEKILQDRNYKNRVKRAEAVKIITRVLIAYDQNPREWFKQRAVELSGYESAIMSSVIAMPREQLRPRKKIPVFGIKEWNPEQPLTREDLEQLMKAQKALGDLFTIRAAIELLIKRHQKA